MFSWNSSCVHIQWCAARCVQFIVACVTRDEMSPQDEPLITEGQEIIPHGLAPPGGCLACSTT